MNFINQISKYVLLISIILNGILLAIIFGMIPFLLYISVIINVIMIWYTSKCLLTINNLENDMVQLLESNEQFLQNLEEIYSLEMYYGDEHIQNLIDESRLLINEFIDVQEKYFDVEVTEMEQDEEDETAPQEK
tara:strand:- start:47923 stop:48324 length:402 start_codon:yes stop_codon:yes gene_type:complete